MSANPNSDLNPVLAAGNCKVSVVSGGKRPVLVVVNVDSGPAVLTLTRF